MDTGEARPGANDGLLRKALVVVVGLRPYAPRHWRPFALGAVAAVFVVVARLALPWPLRAIADLWISDPSGGSASTFGLGLHPALAMGAVFLVLLIALGLADMYERLHFARFSIAVVRDLRADTFRAVVRAHRRDRSIRPGDLVARLVGDTARLKAGMKTFLVHVLTNGILFLGVIAVLLSFDLALGLVFAFAAVATAVVTVLCAARIFRTSLRYRAKEGKLANTIQEGLRYGLEDAGFDKVNHSSGTHEAALTRIQGIATWSTYSAFGVAVMAALWVGVDAVGAGRIAPGDMVVFMMYAVMMRGPIVRLARQGSQTGKMLGAGYRVIQARDEARAAGAESASIEPLRDRIRLEEVLVEGSKTRSSRPRLGPIDATIRAGQHVLVVGEPGAGKSTLLEVLAGLRNPTSGRVLWDGASLGDLCPWALSNHVGFVAQDLKWQRKPVRELLDNGQPGEGPLDELLMSCGLAEVLARLPQGPDTKLGSKDLSPGERRLVGLASLLRADASLWLVDEPTAGMRDDRAAELLDGLLVAAAGRTLVVAATVPPAPASFDRVLELRGGELLFDGPPDEWTGAGPMAPRGRVDIFAGNQR